MFRLLRNGVIKCTMYVVGNPFNGSTERLNRNCAFVAKRELGLS